MKTIGLKIGDVIITNKGVITDAHIDFKEITPKGMDVEGNALLSVIFDVYESLYRKSEGDAPLNTFINQRAEIIVDGSLVPDQNNMYTALSVSLDDEPWNFSTITEEQI